MCWYFGGRKISAKTGVTSDFLVFKGNVMGYIVS